MENTRVACLNFLLQMNQLEDDQVKEWELSVYYSQTRNEKEDEVHNIGEREREISNMNFIDIKAPTLY